MIVERESFKIKSYLEEEIQQVTVENLRLPEFIKLFDVSEQGESDNIEKISLNIPDCEELIKEFNLETSSNLSYIKIENKNIKRSKFHKDFIFIFEDFFNTILFLKYLIKKDSYKYGHTNYFINVSIYKNKFNSIEIFIANRKKMDISLLKNSHLEYFSLERPSSNLSLTFKNLGNIKYYLNKILIRRTYTSEHLFSLNTPSFKKFRE